MTCPWRCPEDFGGRDSDVFSIVLFRVCLNSFWTMARCHGFSVSKGHRQRLRKVRLEFSFSTTHHLHPPVVNPWQLFGRKVSNISFQRSCCKVVLSLLLTGVCTCMCAYVCTCMCAYVRVCGSGPTTFKCRVVSHCGLH